MKERFYGNVHEEEYELWLDKDLYFIDFIEQQESEDKDDEV